MQDYRVFLIAMIISDTLIEIATLALICSVVSAIFIVGYEFKYLILIFASLGWLTDHFIRLVSNWIAFKKLT